MLIQKKKPLIINCDSSQISITDHEYIVSQHPAGMNLCHLGFTALLADKISLLAFYCENGTQLTLESVDKKFRLFPNGKRELACEISRWELEAIDGMIIDCLLGGRYEGVNIDTELFNIKGRVNFIFMISDYFL